jgi:hypothetical protein
MKPEVQPKPSKTVAPVVPEEPPLFSAEGFRRNRSLFIGIGAGLGALLLVMAGIAIYNYLNASANAKAWTQFATARPGLSIASGPPPGTNRTPSDTAHDLEAVLPSLRNTSAEPWALYDLGNAYFALGDPQKARDVFSDLKSRFHAHPLVDKTASTHGSSNVDAAIEDCDKEIEWAKSHPRPQPKPAAAASPSGAASSSTGQTSAPNEGEKK